MNKEFLKMVNKYELYDEIKKSQELNKPTERFMILTYTIAHKILRQRRFMAYTQDWRDECASTALLKCCEVFNKFNLEKTESAYSFFHSVVKHAMIDTINKDYLKYFDFKKELMRISSCLDEHGDSYFDDIDKGE